MLLELLKNPDINQAMHIMRGLDYVFEPPVELASKPLIKIRRIATQVRDHMDLYTSRHQRGNSRAIRELQDVPDLDHFDSSTCSSSATPGDASPIIQSSHLDTQQATTTSLQSVFTSAEHGKLSRPNQVPDISAFPNQTYQNRKHSQRRFIDIDAVSHTPQISLALLIH
jgi:hypothetical protein